MLTTTNGVCAKERRGCPPDAASIPSLFLVVGKTQTPSGVVDRADWWVTDFLSPEGSRVQALEFLNPAVFGTTHKTPSLVCSLPISSLSCSHRVSSNLAPPAKACIPTCKPSGQEPRSSTKYLNPLKRWFWTRWSPCMAPITKSKHLAC